MPMLMLIAKNTPPWVWGLLAVLVALGVSQALPRRMTARRVAVVPVLLLGLSLAGVVSTFAGARTAIAAWAAGLAVALAAGRPLVKIDGARWDAASARFDVPGSWLPLVLILGLFAIKYGVGVTLSIQPALAQDLVFETATSAAYGLFSGLFLARAASLWRLARGGARPAVA